jgi:hypothetical protein
VKNRLSFKIWSWKFSPMHQVYNLQVLNLCDDMVLRNGLLNFSMESFTRRGHFCWTMHPHTQIALMTSENTLCTQRHFLWLVQQVTPTH